MDLEATPDGRSAIAKSTRRLTLDELLIGMTPENEHPLEDDPPRGDEFL